MAGLMQIGGSLMSVCQLTDLTWFTPARMQLNAYGFFVLVMFGSIYYIVPRLIGSEFPSARLIRAHFWLALAGIVLVTFPQAIGGVVQGFKLRDADIPFTDIAKGLMPFMQTSTLGALLIVIGHCLFLVNLAGLVNRFYRTQAAMAYAAVTTDLTVREVKP
jgi:cytochrome c oxidase cbb3-type subunit 1